MLLKKKQKFYLVSRAFTLIELLIVLSIIVILLLVSLPAWHNVITKNQSIAQVDKIVNALQFARTESIKLGKTVKFCKSKDLKKCCTRDCTWQDGQLIVIDDKYGKDNKKVIGVFKSLQAIGQLIWKSNFGSNDFLEFSPYGTTTGQQGSFYYCPIKAKNNALAIIVQQTGHIRVSNKTADGKTIPCK